MTKSIGELCKSLKTQGGRSMDLIPVPATAFQLQLFVKVSLFHHFLRVNLFHAMGLGRAQPVQFGQIKILFSF